MNRDNTFEQNIFTTTINTIPQKHFAVYFPMHWHQYVEIIVDIEDKSVDSDIKSEIVVADKRYTMTAGDILFIWPGELHEISDNSHKSLSGIQFPQSIFHELPELGRYLSIFRSFHLITDEQKLIKETIGAHIKDILTFSLETSHFHETRMRIELYRILIDLGEYAMQTGDGILKVHSSQTIDKIDEACRYIADHCDEELILSDVAEHEGFSTYYFSRVFKSVTGYGFLEYLTNQRLNRAQMLLSDASLSVTDVAYQSGFQSISTFNRAFLKDRGCSPREYRKYYVEKE